MQNLKHREFVKNILLLTSIIQLSVRSTTAIKPREVNVPEGESFSKNMIQTITYNEVSKVLTGVKNDQ